MILDDFIAGALAIVAFVAGFWALDTVHSALLAAHWVVR